MNLFGTAASIQAFLPLLEQGQGKRLWIVSTQAAASVNGWAGQDISAGCKPPLLAAPTSASGGR